MASGGIPAIAAMLCALSLLVPSSMAAVAEASDFGEVAVASPPPARVIGGHARGCLAGGEALPLDGEGYQVMRPSRNRFWGHPQLIAFVETFAAHVQAEGWPGLLIGDLAQPRGGPMTSGHRSHQTGLDVDIWFLAAPRQPLSAGQREEISPVSMIADRIFVNPAIKRELCNSVAGNREWLSKLRPWWGHDAHFHVGLHCPSGDADCLERTPPVPDGDGCDASLDWWFSAEAREELRRDTGVPRPRLTLDELPPACREVLTGG